jgi:diaminopimelate decarboxylase
MFNVESEAELNAKAHVAASIGKVAPIALQGNPDVDSKTHHYIPTGKKESKFGLDIERVEQMANATVTIPSLRMIGLHMHTSSQITTTKPHAGAKGVGLIRRLRRLGHPILSCPMGGSCGIGYKGHEARSVGEFAQAIVPGIKVIDCLLMIETRRVIVGNAGIPVSRVIYTKQSEEKRFLIQGAAMNDLIRSALYESFHRLWPVVVPAELPSAPDDAMTAGAGIGRWDVVRPVCKSGDFLAKDRPLLWLDRGASIATFSAGCYIVAMASNHNTRPQTAEVLVNRAHTQLVAVKPMRTSFAQRLDCNRCEGRLCVGRERHRVAS